MLAPAELHAFAAGGCLGPFDLPEDVTAEFTAAAWLGRVESVLGGNGLGADVLRNQHLHSRSLLRLVTCDAVLGRVRAILGDDVLLWVAHVLARRSGTGGQKWHSDAINQYLRGLHVSIALTEMTRRNGCLSLIPGSHLYRASLWAHEKSRGLDRNDSGAVLRLADRIAPWNAPHEVVHMELQPGQFFFTWGGLWHGVGPNRTESARIACVARYVRPDFQCRDYGFRDDRIEPGEPLPCLLVHGNDDFGLNDLRRPPTGDIFG